MEEYIQRYNEAVFDTDRAMARQVVQDAIAAGVTPEDVVFRIVVPAIDNMMSLLKAPQGVNLAQHFMASQIAAEVTDEMVARFSVPPRMIGRMVIGAAAGDFHGLGKRIVAGCLKARMIDVIDLGLNVSAERFVEQALEQGASVIGISSMMVHTARGDNGSRGVRRLLREKGLEDRIKVVVGGAPYRYDPELYHAVEADAWADNALEAGVVVTRLMEGQPS